MTATVVMPKSVRSTLAYAAQEQMKDPYAAAGIRMQAGMALLDAAGFARSQDGVRAVNTKRINLAYLEQAIKQFQASARGYLRLYINPYVNVDPKDAMEKYLGMTELAAAAMKELAMYRALGHMVR